MSEDKTSSLSVAYNQGLKHLIFNQDFEKKKTQHLSKWDYLGRWWEEPHKLFLESGGRLKGDEMTLDIFFRLAMNYLVTVADLLHVPPIMWHKSGTLRP